MSKKIYNLEIYDDGKVKRGYSDAMRDEILYVANATKNKKTPNQLMINRLDNHLKAVANILMNSDVLETSNVISAQSGDLEQNIEKAVTAYKENLTKAVKLKVMQNQMTLESLKRADDKQAKD